ncbi:nanos homolog 2-like [Genypterus blacodes]|uniref:nanos homolog 2-like n=1 Tax=Genypterus blacodes TaxID=154954 RepID=UPI003F764635
MGSDISKRTTMQRHIKLQRALLRDTDFFDMWHDYMNLGELVQQLGGMREQDTGHGEWSPSPSRSRPPPSEDSAESGSVSGTSDTSSGSKADYCRFCKQNGESVAVYGSHKLKSDEGKVLCPVLWNYTCPICEATGDDAHTRRYCPQAQRQQEANGTLLPKTRFW